MFPIGIISPRRARNRKNITDREYLTCACAGMAVLFPIGNIMTATEFGRIVRENRTRQGLRQDQLAAAAGVGLRFLIELERGKPTAQLGKALAILSALGCTVEITAPPARRSS